MYGRVVAGRRAWATLLVGSEEEGEDFTEEGIPELEVGGSVGFFPQ